MNMSATGESGIMAGVIGVWAESRHPSELIAEMQPCLS
jgi:hypothetical protein